MATRVYGASDDLIEFEGDFQGEAAGRGSGDDLGILVLMSDGTVLECKYGKDKRAIWAIAVLRKGAKFDRVEVCVDEDADPYSDVVHFHDGIRWAYAASEWEAVG